MKEIDARVHQHVATAIEFINGIGLLVQRMFEAVQRVFPPPSKN